MQTTALGMGMLLANIQVKTSFFIDQVNKELVILDKAMFPIKFVLLDD
jgi:hypothetical protein